MQWPKRIEEEDEVLSFFFFFSCLVKVVNSRIGFFGSCIMDQVV